MGVGQVSVAGIAKRFGATDVLHDITLAVEAGQVCALLGPSGSGKTTLLRVIAGLEVPDEGTVHVDERLLVGGGTFVTPERRQIGMVFQDWALFPHLSVADNVGFGLPRGERKGPRVEAALEMVGLGGFGPRMPGTLSGGQQQRVALARALAPQPSVLLLDEPFSNLDAALRVRVRTDVHQLLVDAGITAIFVTHDQEEAFVLGDTVAVMRDGRIVQCASPRVLYQAPADSWLAGFVGDANLLPGDALGDIARGALGEVPLVAPVTGPCEILIRPEHVGVVPADAGAQAGDGTNGDSGDGTNGDGTVELVEYYGHDSLVTVRLADGSDLRARVVRDDLRRGAAVLVRYEGPATTAFPVG